MEEEVEEGLVEKVMLSSMMVVVVVMVRFGFGISFFVTFMPIVATT